jgi:hypothetical protein
VVWHVPWLVQAQRIRDRCGSHASRLSYGSRLPFQSRSRLPTRLRDRQRSWVYGGSPGKVEPHDRVGVLPERPLQDQRVVVAVYHPAVASRDPVDHGVELCRADRCQPGRWWMASSSTRWRTELSREPPGDAAFARP